MGKNILDAVAEVVLRLGLGLVVGSPAVMHLAVIASVFPSIIRVFVYGSCRDVVDGCCLLALQARLRQLQHLGKSGVSVKHGEAEAQNKTLLLALLVQLCGSSLARDVVQEKRLGLGFRTDRRISWRS